MKTMRLLETTTTAWAIALVVAIGSGPARADTVGPNAAAQVRRDANDAATTVRVERRLASAAPAAQHLEIATRNGVVTLGGWVDTEALRRRVVSIATATDGVVDVNDQLVIVPPPAPAADH